jgi:hypothetical protein
MAEELAIKRLRYFNHQFLRVEDFQEEQDYHLRMRRRLNRVLHTWGVAEGLGVTAAAGANSVRVAPGTAIDEQGREIVLLTERVERLATYATRTVFVTLRYLEEPTDETDETGTGLEARRWTERAEVRVVDAAPARQGETLLLARVNLAANGTVASVDEGDVSMRRRYAGVVGGDLEVRSLALASEGRPAAEYPLFRWGAANRADLAGSLSVSARVAVGLAAADAPVHVAGGNWDLAAGEGDVKIGSATHRLKMGVALSGGGAGDARIRSQGGTGRLVLGSGTTDVLAVKDGRVGIGTLDPKAALNVPESGLQIGFGPTAANSFHFVSDEIPAGAPRALRLYGGNYGSGTHLLSVTAAGRVGIGTASPAARLQVAGGAIMPAAGNTAESGIMFPENPGQGGGDAAWIRYYARTGEHTTLEIGTSNDPEDHIALMSSGGVGIGTVTPEDKLHVQGSVRLLGDSNPLRITGRYTGFPNLANQNAEISNDTGDHRTLMIVGNKSGGGPRRVSVWEWLDVFGPLNVTGDILSGAAPGSKFIFHTRGNFAGDSLHVTWDDAQGNWQWGKGLMLRRSDGAFGIGTGDPKDKLHVHGNVRMLTDTNPLRFTSVWSGFPDGTTNQAEICNDTSGHKTLMIIGNRSWDGGTRRVSVWDRLEVTGSFALNTGTGSFLMEEMSGVTHINNTYVLRPHANKHGSIGHPSYLVRNIYVWDLFRSYTYDNSDLRVKENFRPVETPLDKLMRLNGRMYDMKPEFATGPEERLKDNLGFVAQEVGEVFPQLMVYEKESDRYYLNYNGIIPVLVEAVKELKAGVDAAGDARDREIRALRGAQAELAARLAALEGGPARVG